MNYNLRMNLHAGYFALSPALNPFHLFERWLNPTRHQHIVNFRGHAVAIRWTDRAQLAMRRRSSPLIVEMQLYFSCVIQKRVLFHDQAEFDVVAVNDHLRVGFRPVQSTSCDPLEFARSHPVKQEFDSPAAKKMHPRWLQIDYRERRFTGEFGL